MRRSNRPRPGGLRSAWKSTTRRSYGSWLNLAEIEIGVMARQCLARRIPDREQLCRETGAWQAKRNRESVSVDWRFKTEDARIKLKSLYPSIQ